MKSSDSTIGNHATTVFIIGIGLAFAFLWLSDLQGATKKIIADPFDVTCNLGFSNGEAIAGVLEARTSKQQREGLSNRDDVGAGMLFSFDEAEPRVFNMKETRVALSVGFFGADGRLNQISDMEPLTDTRHLSVSPAMYALELPQGQFEVLEIEVGDTLTNIKCTEANP